MSTEPDKTMLDVAMSTNQPVYYRATHSNAPPGEWFRFDASNARCPDIRAYGYEWFVGEPLPAVQAAEQRAQALYNGDPFPGIGAAASSALAGGIMGSGALLEAAPASVGYWTFDERGSFRMFHPARPNWLHRQTCALLLGIKWVDL